MLGRVYIPLLQAQAARTAQAGKLLQAEDAPMARGVLGTLNKFGGHVRSIMHQSQGACLTHLGLSGLSLAKHLSGCWAGLGAKCAASCTRAKACCPH